MGYRSEVAFCLRVKEPEKFLALVKVSANDVIKEMLDNMYYVEDSDGADCLLFTHNYWKWYSESESAFSDLMNMARDYDEDFACKFVRIGEEANDVENEVFGENGWDLGYPCLVQHVDIGCNTEDLKPIIEKEKEDASA